MTRDEFIEKYYHRVYKYLCDEGYTLGYVDDEVDDYFDFTKCFIFVGTQEELAEEHGHEDFYIIAEESGFVMAETFGGIEYNFVK